MNDKLFSAISLCRKANKLKMGTDVVKDEIISGSAALVLLAKDIAERSDRQMQFVCENHKTKVFTLPYTMEELWPITGKKYGVLVVCDRGFAKMIQGLLPPQP